MNRRDFFSSAAFAGIGASLPATMARADGHAAVSLPVAQRYSVGAFRVTVLSDGYLTIDAGTLVGISPEDFATALRRAHIQGDLHPTGVNAFLIETGSANILIDTGTGPVFGPTLGKLGANLAATGVSPDQIDHVVATHLHPDHIGGAFVEQTNPFTKAELIVSEGELNFWTNADIRAQAPDDFKPFFDLANGAVQSFGERVKTVSGEAALASGLTALPLPGHTPGHMGIMVEDGGEQLLIWGDILHVPSVQLADPSVTIAFDADGEMAAATRARILDMAATDGLRVAGAHIDFPGMGYLSKAGTGYQWQNAPYPYL